MDSLKLKEQVRDVVSTLAFAWTSMKPHYMQTVHQLALDSSPATRHIKAPLDTPVNDLVTGTMIRPSEMQNHVLDRVIPSLLPSIQSIGEDLLNDHFANVSSIYSRIEDAVAAGSIDRPLASKAHYWRITRNVLAHGGGIISPRTEWEVMDLFAAKTILFDHFLFWGPLLDAGHRDIPDAVPVPIIDAAVANPQTPGAQCQPINIRAGNRIQIGLADLLAAGEVWADMVHLVCGR
jgi:hypothetical protein